jgi:hypothetical protein
VGSVDVIYYILQYPFIPKNLGAPTMQQVFSPQDETHYTFIITRSPKSSHMSCHTTTPKILDALIISLVGPQKNMQRPLDLSLTFSMQGKFNH